MYIQVFRQVETFSEENNTNPIKTLYWWRLFKAMRKMSAEIDLVVWESVFIHTRFTYCIPSATYTRASAPRLLRYRSQILLFSARSCSFVRTAHIDHYGI